MSAARPGRPARRGTLGRITGLVRRAAADLAALGVLAAVLIVALAYAANLPPTRLSFPMGDARPVVTLRNVYGVEQNALGAYRWTMPEAWFTARVNAPGTYRVTVVLQDSPLVGTPREITLVTPTDRVNYQLTSTPRPYSIDYRAIPGTPDPADWRDLTVVLRASAFVAPGDPRQLGVILTRIDVTPVDTPGPWNPGLQLPGLLLLTLFYAAIRLARAGPALASAVAGSVVGLYGILALAARDAALYLAHQPMARPASIAGIALLCAGAPLAARAREAGRSPRWRLAWLLAGAAAVRLPLLFVPGYDVGESVVWSRVVNAVGIGGAYSATYPGRVNWYHYQPFYLYVLRLTGAIAGWFGLDNEPSRWLVEAVLKGWLVLAELALGYLLYRFVARHATAGLGLWAAAVFLFNPALIWDTAYWGAVDAFHAFFLSAALFAAVEHRPIRSWPLATLAAGTKLLALPGALATVPVAVRREAPRRLVRALAASIVTALALTAPIIARGELLPMIRATLGNLGDRPVVSANAHNLWWLVTGGDGWRSDTQVLLLGITYRVAGLALFGAFALWALVRLWRRPDGLVVICGTGALLTFAFAMVTTEVHENWIYPIFAPLAAVAALDRRYRPLYAALAVTFLANLVLHDRPLYHFLEDRGLGGPLGAARLLNAAARTLVFGWWVWLWTRPEPATGLARSTASGASPDGQVERRSARDRRA